MENKMKFDYQEIETIEEFNLRWYLTPIEPFPSITSMLSKTKSKESEMAIKRWQESIGLEKANKILTDAGTNGTAVHLLCERYLKKEDLKKEEFTQFQLEGFFSLKPYLNKITDVWGQEVALFSKTLRIAGRCDCIGIFEGKESIIDFKTSLRNKNSNDIEDYYYQLAFYAQAHNEMFGTNINNGVILMTNANGLPSRIEVDFNKYYDKLKNRVNEFYKLLLNF